MYIPKSIIKKRQRAFISACLIAVITLTSGGALLLSSPASATSTYTWESDFSGGSETNTEAHDAVTLLPSDRVTDTTVDDFEAGTVFPGSENPFAITNTSGGELTLEPLRGYLYGDDSFYLPDVTEVRSSFIEDGYLYASTNNGLVVIDTQNTPDPIDDTIAAHHIEGEDVYYALLEDDMLYVGTSYVLRIFDTKGTVNQTDDSVKDVLFDGDGDERQVNHFVLVENILYIATSRGLLVYDINTETILHRYVQALAPPIPSNDVRHVYLQDDLIYVSAWGAALSVIDTQGTLTKDDDSVELVSTNVRNDMDNLDNYLGYIGTVYEGEALFENATTTNGTFTASVPTYGDGGGTFGYVWFDFGYPDDFFSGSSTVTVRLRLNNDEISTLQADVFVDDVEGDYEGEDNEVDVVNEWVTISIVPDVDFTAVGIRLDCGGGEDCSINPADSLEIDYIEIDSPVRFTLHVNQDGNFIYASNGWDGLFVIDTKGTAEQGDNTIAAIYDDETIPTASSPFAAHSFIDPELERLFISNENGVYAFDTQGTTDVSDDEFFINYGWPEFDDASVYGPRNAYIYNNTLYIDNASGISIIPLTASYETSASYLSAARTLPDTPSISLSRVADVTTDHTVSLAYRYSNTASPRDDFNTGDNYRGDFYEYGDFFQSTSTTNGIFTASNPLAPYGGYFWFELGYPQAEESGIEVSARIRMSSTTDGSFYANIFTDNYESSTGNSVTTEWRIITLEAYEAFSHIGFEISCIDDDCSWDPEDSVEIDYIQVTPPPTWSDWSTPCTDSVCPINQADIEDAISIQYRLDLATDDTSTTPIVYSVSFNGAYATSGTYTSTTETFDRTETLGTFAVDDSTPAGTSISYAYTIDGGASWTPITPGTRINKQASSFAWRATLSTTDTSLTPSITRVTLSLGSAKKGSGTSIERRIQILEAQGETDKALRLRTLWEEKMRSGTPVTEEDLVPFLEELVSLLEQLLAVKRGG